MKEETWFKMLVVSTILHILIVGAFSIPMKKSSKKISMLSSYTVNLVGDPGAGALGGDGRMSGPAQAKKAPEAKVTKPVPAAKKPAPVKTKPKLERKEKETAVSLSRKKAPAKEATTREELSRLNDRIKEIRKRTDYLDVSRAPGSGGSPGKTGGSGYGLPGSSEGGARPMDPVSQQYILGIWEKIKNSWGLPGMSSFKKDLETVVTIKIRKDGRIVDINIEKRSGNRMYDESILRVLRSVDPLPSIPASLNMDTMEIGFRFLPGDLS
ncbi:MAG: cell envelope integrity protein TolA [Proteobacteria bacterium]|nr:cell envelope integrity protein TolA [Pseudomonadota bacterium]